MKLSNEKLIELNRIPTKEVEQDLEEAKTELKQYEDEKDTLSKDRVRNKVQIYFLEGKISKGNEFIDELNQILNFRKEK